MKKMLSAIVILAAFSGAGETAEADGGHLPAKEPIETNQVIITVKEDAGINLKSSDAVSGASEGERLISVEVPENQSVDAFVEELEKNEDIQHAEPDLLVELDYSPNDPDAGQLQYHHQKMETQLAWDKTRGSADVIVAVIDDGVDMSQPDLKKQLVHPFDTIKENSGIAAGEHGTHVAGIIGSSIDNSIGGAGIAPNAKIMPIDVFDGEFAYISEVIEGIYHAVDQGADIINLSMGSYEYSAAFDKAIQDAHKKGVVIVAAAGNESAEKAYYPASYSNVISVASSTSLDTASDFSNYGSHIDIAAPGTSIYSTLPKGGYGFMDGTSMAAPMVSGAAALIKASEPALSNIEIENRLYATADDLGAAGKDPVFGHGRVNVRKALLINYMPAPVVDPVDNAASAITGKAEPNTTVHAYAGNVKLGEGVAAGGAYSIKISKQTAGTSIAVHAVNAAGDKSAVKMAIVAAAP